MQIELCKHCVNKVRCNEMGWGPSRFRREPDLSGLDKYLTGRETPRGFFGNILCKLYVEDMPGKRGSSPPGRE